MSQATSLSIANGAAVAKTFAPVPYPNQLTGYENRESGVIATFSVITVSVRRPRAGVRNPVYRVLIRTRVVEPQVVGIAASGITPPVQAQSTAWSNHEFVIPASMSASLRGDLYAFAQNLLAKAEIKAAVIDLDQPMA